MQEITQPLSALPSIVKAIRTQSQPARIVLRNTERMGVVHLYFAGGLLVHVEGHRGPGAESLADVANWEGGVIRSDPLPEPPLAPPDAQLEATLRSVIQRLEVRGITPRSDTPGPLLPHRAPTMPPPPLSQPGFQRRTYAFPLSSHPSQVPGLPPLPSRDDTIILPSPAPAPDALTDPQWQLLVLAVHEVVERAAHQMPRTVAEGLLAQTLTALSTQRRFLTTLEVDTTGWLRSRQEGSITAFAANEVVDNIAALLTEFERRCAVIVGAKKARQILVEGCQPFRAPLAQIGLAVATA